MNNFKKVGLIVEKLGAWNVAGNGSIEKFMALKFEKWRNMAERDRAAKKFQQIKNGMENFRPKKRDGKFSTLKKEIKNFRPIKRDGKCLVKKRDRKLKKNGQKYFLTVKRNELMENVKNVGQGQESAHPANIQEQAKPASHPN